MVDKIRIAVIFSEEFKFLKKDYRDNTLYYLRNNVYGDTEQVSVRELPPIFNSSPVKLAILPW